MKMGLSQESLTPPCAPTPGPHPMIKNASLIYEPRRVKTVEVGKDSQNDANHIFLLLHVCIFLHQGLIKHGCF
jgi:hypothetical protein